MALTLYYMSGSPYAWRVWLALEHKQIPCELKTMSYDAGDFKKPEFLALTPRRKVPVIVDDGFALYESAAIVEYLEDKQPTQPRLFSADLRQRAIERRLVREADQYFAAAMEHLVDFTLYPQIALVQRIGSRNPGLLAADMIGPSVSAWMRRMEALPCTRKTWPPHWQG